MQPNQTSSKPSKSALSRYIIPLIALVAIVGGLAWVAQYLPSWNKSKDDLLPGPNKDLVEFRFRQARWEKKPDDKTAEPADPSRDVESGSKGHYDFPFKNVLGQDLEIVGFVSTCDCSTVKVCIVPTEEWDRLKAVQDEKPGEDLSYAAEPKWEELWREGTPEKSPVVPLKAGERGMVRIEWRANKAPGQELKLHPAVIFRRAGDVATTRVPLLVPVKISQPVQFNPTRVDVGQLVAGKAVKTFKAWSSTRAKLDLSLVPTPADPHFVFEVKEYDKQIMEKELIVKKLGSRVLSAYEITLTVYETKDGRQLDQGTFYRKWPVTLDGRLDQELYGPEFVGRVKGDIQIGGDEDRGRIRFKSFDVKIGASQKVELGADAKIELEPFKKAPSWITVTLTKDRKEADVQIWKLEVEVPPNTRGARPFGESDAVTLKIKGTPERFLRIPLEGHISGH
jgi:hypothetical protein